MDRVNQSLPFPRSYWVLPGKLLAGAYPGSKDPDEAGRKLKGLIDCGVRHVVNLMEENEVNSDGEAFVPYQETLTRFGAETGISISHIGMSIRDLHIPTVQKMRAILDEIDQSITRSRPVYVHCWGGRGRTGTVVGCYLVRHGLKGEEALARIKERRRNEPTSHHRSPETALQRQMVLAWDREERQGFSQKESTEPIDRCRGCLLGLAVGDALGTTLEFKPPGTFRPVEDMVGGGPFGLKAGKWTDDTSMALCLAESFAESFIECRGFDPKDQMERYVRWYRQGHLSSTGPCFDIGNTIREALDRFGKIGESFAGSTHPRSAGNGSIMRLAPVPLSMP